MKLVRELSEHAREWRNNPEVYATCRQHLPISKHTHERYLNRIEADPSIEFFGIEIPTTDSSGYKDMKVIGQCGLTDCDYINSRAEYSMLIAPEYQGKGYATEAIKLLLDYAFNDMNLHQVWGEIIANNMAGLELAKKCHFRVDGIRPDFYYKCGTYYNSYHVSITKAEWLKSS